MKKDKIEIFEKQLIKGLISLKIAKEIDLHASEVEYEIMKITGNSNMEHRDRIEVYVQAQINKIN